MSAPWSSVLATVAERLTGGGVEWMLLGSAATALRGAAIVPGDIDIAALTAADVSRAAVTLPTPAVRPESDEWISTTAEPTLQFGDGGECWTFGRWYVDGVKFEIAHIDAPAVASLMVETRSPAVWRERDILDCHGQPVPTVAVEVQLATMAVRQQHARIEATLAVVGQLDRRLLQRAIADRRVDGAVMAVPLSLQRVLEADM